MAVLIRWDIAGIEQSPREVPMQMHIIDRAAAARGGKKRHAATQWTRECSSLVYCALTVA